MTENENSAARQHGNPEVRRPSGHGRLLPKVTFGLGAAVLAGAVAVTVPAAPAAAAAAGSATGTVTVTVGLGAVINVVAGTGMLQTTCCGSRLSAFIFPAEPGQRMPP
jgi:hypothetical protein